MFKRNLSKLPVGGIVLRPYFLSENSIVGDGVYVSLSAAILDNVNGLTEILSEAPSKDCQEFLSP